MSKRKHIKRPRNRKPSEEKKTGLFAWIFRRLCLMFFIAIAVGLAKYGTIVWVLRLFWWAVGSVVGEVVVQVLPAA